MNAGDTSKNNWINAHTSSVAPPWSNSWPTTWWISDIFWFLWCKMTAAEDTKATCLVMFIVSSCIWEKAGALSFSSFAMFRKSIESMSSVVLPLRIEGLFLPQRSLHSSFTHFERTFTAFFLKFLSVISLFRMTSGLLPLTIPTMTLYNPFSLIILVQTFLSFCPLYDTYKLT